MMKRLITVGCDGLGGVSFGFGRQVTGLKAVPQNNPGCRPRMSQNTSALVHTHGYQWMRTAHVPRRAHSAVARSGVSIPPLEMSSLLASQPGMWVGIAANTMVYIVGNKVLLRGLTWEGYFSSWVLGALSFSAFGVYGYSVVCLYFIVGSWVTKLKMEVKEKEGTAEARGGRRGIGSVLGSGVAGMACAALALSPLPVEYAMLQVGFLASFCSKLSDTVSSEIGKAYGRTTYLATTFAPVPRGTEGAVSAEGTLAGVVASVLLSGYAFLVHLIDMKGFFCVVCASLIANYIESVIGASFQDTIPWLTNNVVNMIQITLASVIAMGLCFAI